RSCAMSDVERDVFFAQATGARRSWIASAMAWIEHDAPELPRTLLRDPRLGASAVLRDVDHQAKWLWQIENAARSPPSQVEHDPRVMLLGPDPHALHQPADVEALLTTVACAF